ncbi:2-hydroxyacid dehydrogenase [Aliivibrio fischeri]|uniref:Fermentative D-lactate dehydrogenase, NAD-dependent n=1 Tax=Aliivibrio fischeri SR5 TaxID=1088719 RepID=A0AAV3EUU1_ALIFS|nr:2-hydroxyacid dehydrogenase [Aliivibrio fischeri]EHN70695.1 fermentative D-lactate dehydrogenase, NAD-dependent [Aliivibrio fischeri SR5]MCE7534601.1 2-hydroxyacid dehydrogenase [Aliivibrio fischeri]MCE7554051.1 2-hydroxyacid dehydrogenase [Aliivibrio fischeri]MCE7557563.1 2-hydroxyacid dehydrogenase [Aliivibrio fischeri]MCE7561097.1 2-hydroxyacid dehydrogenase [Aliivibrio fischeri]
MKIAMFSTKSYDETSFNSINQNYQFECQFFNFQLTESTAPIANGADVVCAFVNDDLSAPVLEILAKQGTKLIAMRCAGFDRVDLEAAKKLGMQVVRVPAYSPEAIAEHAVGMMMCLNRRFHKAYQRTRDANFSLEGLTGFNFFGKTVGVIGSGKIGLATMRILKGLGMNILCFDPYPSQVAIDMGVKYTTLDEIFSQSDVITLHCPLTPENTHLLDTDSFSKMKDGVMIINTSRGGLLNSASAIEALKAGKIGSLGLDVYDHEKELFFQDKSNDIIKDDVFRRLSACHNVLFTGHQAFLTEEALDNIASTTLGNIDAFLKDETSGNELITN